MFYFRESVRVIVSSHVEISEFNPAQFLSTDHFALNVIDPIAKGERHLSCQRDRPPLPQRGRLLQPN